MAVSRWKRPSAGGVRGRGGRDHLDRDDLAVTEPAGPVDDAHAATADLFEHLVTGDGGSVRAGAGSDGSGSGVPGRLDGDGVRAAGQLDLEGGLAGVNLVAVAQLVLVDLAAVEKGAVLAAEVGEAGRGGGLYSTRKWTRDMPSSPSTAR